VLIPPWSRGSGVFSDGSGLGVAEPRGELLRWLGFPEGLVDMLWNGGATAA